MHQLYVNSNTAFLIETANTIDFYFYSVYSTTFHFDIYCCTCILLTHYACYLFYSCLTVNYRTQRISFFSFVHQHKTSTYILLILHIHFSITTNSIVKLLIKHYFWYIALHDFIKLTYANILLLLIIQYPIKNNSVSGLVRTVIYTSLSGLHKTHF